MNRGHELFERRTVFGIGFDTVMNGTGQNVVDFGTVFLDRGRGLIVSHRRLTGIPFGPRQLACAHFVHRNAKREDVDLFTRGATADQFRGDVVGVARAVSRLGEWRSVRNSQTEIDQFESGAVAGKHPDE